jgi:hypothetical protein
LDETLTVIELGLPKTLRQSLQTTNVIESALSIAEDTSQIYCPNETCKDYGKRDKET